ncbi:hypothetical protein Afil01_58820 [Actinorhabdospora filicis]|uniref:LPXTG-motif cell wall-anchored protein n=1 Tax=Actinorhabdospora filicis TaxID=1785913 RepID=A0A9W6SSC9_9ACTN|nr:Ig-like domain-containing protein [Actinorhabdospora filicis]GLZ81075.1 hypothetical protein Afil01_58820 [Actinorhabdospora filicis]
MTRTARSVTRVLGVAGAAFALSLAAPALAYADEENGAPTCTAMSDRWLGTADLNWSDFDCQDPDNDDITATAASIKSGPGTVKIATGTVTYTGDKTGTGPAVVTVTVSDGHEHTATVDITVTYDLPVEPPVANDDLDFTVKANEVLTGNVAANDQNVTGGLFEVTVQPAHGTVTLDPKTGAFTYTPVKDYEGPDGFTYKVTVGGKASDTAVVKIVVKPKGTGGGPSTSPSPSPSKTPGKGLAKTGSPLLTVALTGAGVLVAGGVVLFVARRRREV